MQYTRESLPAPVLTRLVSIIRYRSLYTVLSRIENVVYNLRMVCFVRGLVENNTKLEAENSKRLGLCHRVEGIYARLVNERTELDEAVRKGGC
jgi:hypothetical protein